MLGELKRISERDLKPTVFVTLLGGWSPGETHKPCPKSDTRLQAGFATALIICLRGCRRDYLVAAYMACINHVK
jgi:hypothetical protein